MIHGLPSAYAWLGSARKPSPIGPTAAFALTNAEMDEVWKLVPLGTPIEIAH